MTSTEIKTIATKASKIIFENEGGYGSVNKNDKGAVSVGRIQWHGNRALSLLKKIVKENRTVAQTVLETSLYDEIIEKKDWSKRVVSSDEASQLSKLLSSTAGKKVQDEQSILDVTGYVKSVISNKVTSENAIIFMADIANQGGTGASTRIIKAAKNKTIDGLYAAAKVDKVFKNYQSRRAEVYKKLMGYEYGSNTKKTTTATNTSTKTSTNTSTNTSIKEGQAIKLSKCPLYATATATKKAGSKTGTFYIWSTKTVNGRIRITNSKSKVGNKNGVTGWILVSAIK